MTLCIHGLSVAHGVAQGRAVPVLSSSADVARYHIEPDQVQAELARMGSARDAVVHELEALRAAMPVDAPVELAALIDVHLQVLQDEMLESAVARWITEHQYNAEWALTTQMEIFGRQFDAMDDAYLRERKADLEQVVERVLHHLLGAARPQPAANPGEPRILVARDLSPADLLQFRDGAFAGFVTEVGAVTSHTAIVARSMDIPAVVAARGISQLVRPDDWLIIDGEAGAVIIDPSPGMRAEYAERQREAERRNSALESLRLVPACTRDGHAVQLLANIEQPSDVEQALHAGAVGIGLFRSEFLFMGRAGRLPDEEEQYHAYRTVVEGMGGLPVTIRTIDIGADKPLDSTRASPASNPALGLRAIRWSLADPSMFRTQLRALLRAAAHGPVSVMFPMLAHPSEVRQTLEQVALARQELAARGAACGAVRLGAMVEVPAAALMAEEFLRSFDFLSIGTNDLIQYTLAIDRTDEAVAHLYDPLHPAVLRLLESVIAVGARCGKEVSVCGEMAGDAALTPLLLGLGLRSFSMQPAHIPRVKQQILESEVAALTDRARQAAHSESPRTVLGLQV